MAGLRDRRAGFRALKTKLRGFRFGAEAFGVRGYRELCVGNATAEKWQRKCSAFRKRLEPRSHGRWRRVGGTASRATGRAAIFLNTLAQNDRLSCMRGACRNRFPLPAVPCWAFPPMRPIGLFLSKVASKFSCRIRLQARQVRISSNFWRSSRNVPTKVVYFVPGVFSSAGVTTGRAVKNCICKHCRRGGGVLNAAFLEKRAWQNRWVQRISQYKKSGATVG